MPRKRHHKPIVLTDDERRTLEQWARRPTTAQRLASRSRMVLACAEGLTNRAVAKRLRVSSNSVCKWRERFRVRRLPGLTDEPRPGAPRKATDDRIVEVITRTLEGPPAHATQWTTRSMADVAGFSKATIARIWQTFGLQSHRLDTFKLSADPQFVEKVRDIVGCISVRLIAPSSCRWTKKAKSRPWTGRGRSCRCAPASRPARRMTTSATARPRCSRPWTSRPGK